MIKRTMSQNKKIVSTVAISCVISIILSILGVFVIALLLNKEVIEETAMGYGIMIVTVIAAIAGSINTFIKTTKYRLVLTVVTAATYYMALLLLGLAIFGDTGKGGWVTALLVIGCGGCVSLLGLKQKKTRYSFRYK